jgi:riboflavin biosynthesis pyrimidine reductase
VDHHRPGDRFCCDVRTVRYVLDGTPHLRIHGSARVLRRGHGAARLCSVQRKDLCLSRSLQASDYPDITIVATDQEKTVQLLREQPGKDIWLFGGGQLFSSLLDANLVDTVELAIIPVLLGGGIPMLACLKKQTQLKLKTHKIYKSGIVALEYSVKS